MTSDREEHMREQIKVIRALCEDRVYSEEAVKTRNIQLMASVPALLDWLTEALDEIKVQTCVHTEAFGSIVSIGGTCAICGKRVAK